MVRFDGQTGDVLWQLEIDGSGNDQDEASDVVLNSEGDVVASGFIYGAQSIHDFAVLRVDGQTGTVTWQQTLDGEAHWADLAQAEAVDPNDDVVARGRSSTATRSGVTSRWRSSTATPAACSGFGDEDGGDQHCQGHRGDARQRGDRGR